MRYAAHRVCAYFGAVLCVCAQVLLWRAGDAPPALPAGDAELLVPLARAEGLLDGHNGAEELPDWAPFDGEELDGDDAAQ